MKSDLLQIATTQQVLEQATLEMSQDHTASWFTDPQVHYCQYRVVPLVIPLRTGSQHQTCYMNDSADCDYSSCI